MVSMSLPASLITVKVTSYTPGLLNVCVAFIACFELIPSPKSQYQEVGVLPVPISMNNITKVLYRMLHSQRTQQPELPEFWRL